MAHIQKSEIRITDVMIREIIREYNKTYKIKNIVPVEEGVANPVYIIETQKTDLVLRILNPISGDWKPGKEELVYELFRKNNIPCPVILKTDISKRIIPFNYIISKRLKGNALNKEILKETTSKTKIVKELGKYLGRIHSISFNRFGDVYKRSNKFVVGPAHELCEFSKRIKTGPFYSWKDMHREIIKYGLYYFKDSEFKDLIEPIKKYFKKHERLIDYKITPRLLHLDLNRNNIFVKNNKITGILDVEGALIGHNEYDLMRTELHFKGNLKLRNAFFKEYTKYIKLDKGYEERRPYYSLSRALIGVRCLVLWKSRYTKKAYLKEKKWIRNHINNILQQDRLEL